MAVIRSTSSTLANSDLQLVIIAGAFICMILATMGIKFRWFKHRMTFDSVPTSSTTAEVVPKRHSSEDLNAEPRILRATFRMDSDFDSVVDITPLAVLPPVRIRNKNPPLLPKRRPAPQPIPEEPSEPVEVEQLLKPSMNVAEVSTEDQQPLQPPPPLPSSPPPPLLTREESEQYYEFSHDDRQATIEPITMVHDATLPDQTIEEDDFGQEIQIRNGNSEIAETEVTLAPFNIPQEMAPPPPVIEAIRKHEPPPPAYSSMDPITVDQTFEAHGKNVMTEPVFTVSAPPQNLPIIQPTPEVVQPKKPKSPSSGGRGIFNFLLPSKSEPKPKIPTSPPPTATQLAASMPQLNHTAESPRPLPRTVSTTSLDSPTKSTSSSFFSFLSSSKGTKAKIPASPQQPVAMPRTSIPAAESSSAEPPPPVPAVRKEKVKKAKPIRVLKSPKPVKIKPALKNPMLKKEQSPHSSVKFAKAAIVIDDKGNDEPIQILSEDEERRRSMDGQKHRRQVVPIPATRNKPSLSSSEDENETIVDRSRIGAGNDDDGNDDAWNQVAQHRHTTQQLAAARAASRQRRAATKAAEDQQSSVAAQEQHQQRRQIEIMHKPKTMREMQKDRAEQRVLNIEMNEAAGAATNGKVAVVRQKQIDSDTEA